MGYGHTYAQLLCHGVFSTKDRRSHLKLVQLEELARVVGGIIRERKGKLLEFGGADNHVHLLASFHPQYSVSDMFRDIKAVSSDWIHSECPGMQAFAWQQGYGVFSVSKSNVPQVGAYVANQTTHHHEKSFEEEFAELLQKHGIEYDQKFFLG